MSDNEKMLLENGWHQSANGRWVSYKFEKHSRGKGYQKFEFTQREAVIFEIGYRIGHNTAYDKAMAKLN